MKFLTPLSKGGMHIPFFDMIRQDFRSFCREVKRILTTKCNSDLNKKQKVLIVCGIYGFTFLFWECCILYYQYGIEEPVFLMTWISAFIFMRSKDRDYLINRYFSRLPLVFHRRKPFLSHFKP